MTSIEDLVGQVFGNNSSSTNIINSETSDSGGNGKGNRRSKNRNKRSEKEQDQVNARHKRPYTVYKYSNKLKGPVYEGHANLPIQTKQTKSERRKMSEEQQ
jgi:hypothetical protein